MMMMRLLVLWAVLCWPAALLAPSAPAATHWLDKHTHFFMSLRLLHNIPFLRIVNVTSNKDVDGDHKCLNNRYHLKKEKLLNTLYYWLNLSM